MNGADRDSVMVDTNSWDVDQKKKKTKKDNNNIHN